MKGQSAIEFMIYVCVVTLILAILLWSNNSMEKRMIGIKTVAEAEKLCNNIAFEINSAVRSGDGYSRKFYVDDSLYGISNFLITVGNYSVYIDWDNNFVRSNIIIKNLTNTNTISPGFNFIQNKNGEIDVTSL
jgi:uncharacterized membrane protein YhhN